MFLFSSLLFKVENFTVSFSDGRAFCCLLHHYHPVLLPHSEINFETTLSFQADAEVLSDEKDVDLSMDCSGRQNGLLQSGEIVYIFGLEDICANLFFWGAVFRN